MPRSDALPAAYPQLLTQLKVRVRTAQLRAAVAVNRELVLLYYGIGRDILEQQRAEGWGAKVIDRLASDLQREFPGMKGFSARNLKYMRAFAEAWPGTDGEQFVQQVAAQMPWFHNCVLLDQVKDPAERAAYARAAVEHGWSRNVLVMQIESGFVRRKGQAAHNFSRTLPPPQSDLATQTLKDPYLFDFLGLSGEVEERRLERALVTRITDLLLELGVGFAFVGRQVKLTVGGEDFYVDLLFYHLKLRCYVVVELKTGPFQPEFAGKINFYLAAADDLIRDPEKDGPTIGLLLCKSRNRFVVEYALRDTTRPIGVAAWQLTRSLPPTLDRSLPTVDILEAELADEVPSEELP